MVAAMAASNLSRQQQCLNTPSMSSPFIDNFGYLADTAAASAVISRTYVCPLNMDPYLAEFLATLTMPEAVCALGPLDCSITTEGN